MKKCKKIDIALKKFTRNEITVSTAAKIAGLPLTTFLDVLSNKKIRFHYGLKELQEDFERLI
ncbi:UPF0175 family protein [Candidatus Woesearchaeota archaeon]|nr:UPF0175 family protein [Candidatus Woesearchaeota archaeon]